MDKDLDGQRHAMPLAMHVEKDLLDRFLEVCVCHTLTVEPVSYTHLTLPTILRV